MNIWQKSSTRISLNKPKHGGIAVLFAVLCALLLASFLCALAFGSTPLDLLRGIGDLLRGDTSSPDGRILLYIRLPRACAAVLAGAALAVAGVIIQAVLHNPMAAPNVIGVNSGAGLGAVLMLAVFPSALSFLPLAAFVGAMVTCLCIYAISARTGADRMTVTLVGIAVASLLNAAINTVKILYPDSVYDADSFMIGGFSGVTFSRLFPAGMIILGGLLVACFFAWEMDVLALGDDTAKSLGVNVKRVQLLLLLLACALAGGAVSFSGLLGFVGLLVPHLARRFVGENHRILVPVSALGGAVLVLVCDMISRVLFAPYELPVGILLSFVGGPFFIFLILAGRKRHA